MQVQQHLEGPIGMALYEWQDGQIGMACVHGGSTQGLSLMTHCSNCSLDSAASMRCQDAAVPATAVSWELVSAFACLERKVRRITGTGCTRVSGAECGCSLSITRSTHG